MKFLDKLLNFLFRSTAGKVIIGSAAALIAGINIGCANGLTDGLVKGRYNASSGGSSPSCSIDTSSCVESCIHDCTAQCSAGCSDFIQSCTKSCIEGCTEGCTNAIGEACASCTPAALCEIACSGVSGACTPADKYRYTVKLNIQYLNPDSTKVLSSTVIDTYYEDHKDKDDPETVYIPFTSLYTNNYGKVIAVSYAAGDAIALGDEGFDVKTPVWNEDRDVPSGFDSAYVATVELDIVVDRTQPKQKKAINAANIFTRLCCLQ